MEKGTEEIRLSGEGIERVQGKIVRIREYLVGAVYYVRDQSIFTFKKEFKMDE